ncbi:MAG TPA: hypothetical protein VKA89_02135, partial [Solirubrobacterales bacterium]|nr:hypothetical protein [Solirubrobacterales bacterium]
MEVAAALLAGALLVLAAIAFGPDARRPLAALRPSSGARRRPARFDPGRERRAEVKARELLRSVVGERAFEMYCDLGFLRVAGKAGEGYSYLVYPHRPVIAYDEESGDLLNEYCVGFPDHSDATLGHRLPDSDDVLAKWMALEADEKLVIGESNLDPLGRQLDPGMVRRDLRALRDWENTQARLLRA